MFNCGVQILLCRLLNGHNCLHRVLVRARRAAACGSAGDCYCVLLRLQHVLWLLFPPQEIGSIEANKSTETSTRLRRGPLYRAARSTAKIIVSHAVRPDGANQGSGGTMRPAAAVEVAGAEMVRIGVHVLPLPIVPDVGTTHVSNGDGPVTKQERFTVPAKLFPGATVSV
jgi:hypothetical protein